MHLYALPLIFVLIGLILYTVLAGADFGAGVWQLLSGRGADGERIRDHAHDSMAPVWEANHVWLIFALTVMWTAYPTAFASIASTLSVPLFLAAIGIILRGAAYAVRAGGSGRYERGRIDTVFALSSLLTPFALGTMVGAIASRRVPVGNAAGATFSSWLNATSLTIGVLAVVSSAYLAAVFLAADAERVHDQWLLEAFRRRALVTGAIAGALALGGLFVLHGDSHRLFERLLHREAFAGPVISAIAGTLTMLLIARRRFQAARFSAAAAVAAVVGGWGYAQSPTLLPGLTVRQAAAPHDALVAVVVAVLVGALLLAPSLGLLFRLVLSGRLDPDAAQEGERRGGISELLSASASGILLRLAGGAGVAGFGLLTLAEAGWAHAAGVLALVIFMLAGFAAALPTLLQDPGVGRQRRPGPGP
jgi:cytochrome d ubiquinol oxidase subunit II